MNTHWANEEELLNDMMEMSDFCNSTTPKPSPEPSEIRRKLCGVQSIYDMDVQDEAPQEECTVIPVRGHPLIRDRMRRPGGRPTTTNGMHLQTAALIREVSGFGYSNDLIEHALKGSNSEDEKDPEKMSNLCFESSSLQVNKASGSESDSSTSTSSEYIYNSSPIKSTRSINGPDINSKIDFPDLK